MNNAEQFNDRELVAIQKAIAEALVNEAKANIPQGTEEDVDILVRIQGSIKKGVDGTTKSWTKAKYDLLAGIALSHMNETTRAAIVREYVEVVKEHNEAEAKAKEVASEIKEQADKALADVLGHTVVPRKGTVTAKLTATKLDPATGEPVA